MGGVMESGKVILEEVAGFPGLCQVEPGVVGHGEEDGMTVNNQITWGGIHRFSPKVR
jgi:hypothetical protein